MPDLLNLTQIDQYLRELAGALDPEGPTEVVVVVGGALLAYHGIREGTRGVDSAGQFGEEIKAAAAAVGERHDLAPDWLNARAAAFRPKTLDEADCDVFLEQGRLLVLTAPVDQVFLMKLNSSRSADQADLVLAWPHTSFETAQEVVDAFWRAFPEAPEDEYMKVYVQGIIDEATKKS
ncbi:MAG: hypothetical protein OEM39_09385 [Acidimicrobiia bacterium]|nr:hypothetical protein [Acidimicrobiia bacterium]